MVFHNWKNFKFSGSCSRPKKAQHCDNGQAGSDVTVALGDYGKQTSYHNEIWSI